MAQLYSQDVQITAVPVPVTTTFETLVVIGDALTLPFENGKAFISCWMYLSPGVGTTAVQLLIRAGKTITGRVVGASLAVHGDFTAGNPAFFVAQTVDVVASGGDVQYCVSLIQTAATADGNVESAIIQTTLLSG